MKVGCLIKMLEQCDPAAHAMFFCDDEVFNIGFVEHSLTDNSIYLYQEEPNFVEQSEDRDIETVVHSITYFEGAAQLLQTSYTKPPSQKYQRETIDDYAGEDVLDRYIDPEELNVDR